MAISEMKRSLWVALNSAVSRWIDNRVSNGDVNSVVTITAYIAHARRPAQGQAHVRTQLADAFQAGERQPGGGEADQQFALRHRRPGERLAHARHHCAGEKCRSEMTLTTRSTANAANAMIRATVALSRMPMTFKSAKATSPAQANTTMWPSMKGDHAGDVMKAGDRGDRRGQKIAGGNQHAAKAAPHGTEGFGGRS